jgi:hypothetical protein
MCVQTNCYICTMPILPNNFTLIFLMLSIPILSSRTPILIPLLCYTVFGDPKVSISMTAIYAVGRVPIRINFSNHVLLLDFTSSSMRWKLRILSLYILDYVLFSSGYTLPRPFQMSLISKYLSCQDSHHPQISYLFQNIV